MSQADASTFERTLTLGKELAAELSDSNVLGRWMSHHVSELIIRAETVTGGDKVAAEHEAAEAILKLWAHRKDLPTSRYPLESFEPVFAALNRLGQSNSAWSFYRLFEDGEKPSDRETVRVPILAAALNSEEEVRDVVTAAVIVAAHEATDREAGWLKVSEHLAEDQERTSLRAIRSLQQAVLRKSHNTGNTTEEDEQDVDLGPDAENELDSLRSALDKAIESMSQFRNALEEVSDETNDGTPDT
jgi:hypothetical protein